MANTKQRMDIKFLVNPVYVYGPDGWSPDSTRLGGTEESVIEWSKELRLRGHRVRVYHNGKHGTWDGVEYLDHTDYVGGDGVTINVKYSTMERQEPTWYLTNEMNARDLQLTRYDGVILPSKWALDMLMVKHPRIRVVPHGFDRSEVYADRKIENQCLYSSSPDRGLEDLLNFWPKVVEQVPNAQLIVTYDGTIDAPNTICLGSVDIHEMNQLYRESDFWLHPCNGGELFCMAGVKAQAAEAIPVFYPVMALKETIRHGIRCDATDFVSNLVSIMGNKHKQKWLRTKMHYEPYADWKDSTDILEKAIKEFR